MNNFKQLVASVLIVGLTTMGFPLAAQASIVPTEQIVTLGAAASNRDRVSTFMARKDVRQAMSEQGVSPEAAAARVAAMSDNEVAQLAGRIDQAPAGGEVLGLIFTVFIVLLITDILGFTKVFPFTRSVR